MAGTLDSAEDLRPPGERKRIPARIVIVPECTSTNDLALESGEATGDGNVYLAEYQQTGRGRLGSVWHAPRGASVLCSIRIIEEYSRQRWCRLALAAGIALHETVRQSTDAPAELKWPNDVLLNRKKVAGVLIETRALSCGRHVVAVGMGINCLQNRAHFPSELEDLCTSLELESDQPVDRSGVARSLVRSLDTWMDPDVLNQPDALSREWLARADTIGSRLHIRSEGREFKGVVLDLDPDAGILVALDEGAHRLFCPLTSSILKLPR